MSEHESTQFDAEQAEAAASAEWIDDQLRHDREAIPVCLKCLTPSTPFDHYCSRCGFAVGRFTRYIPFVNIPWEVDFWARVASIVRSRNRAFVMRGFGFVLILFGAPSILLGIVLGTRPDITRDG